MEFRLKKSVRFLGWAFLLLALIFSLAILAMTWTSHQNRRRAEELLRDVQSLTIGTSSAEEGLQIIHKYGGKKETSGYLFACGTGASRYSISVVNDYALSTFADYSLLPTWFALPYRVLAHSSPPVWSATASITVDSAKTVCTSFGVLVFRSDGVILGATVTSWPPDPPSDIFAPHPAYFGPSQEPPYHGGTGIDMNPRADMIDVYMTHEATPEERRRAFDFNLDCLTRVIGECRQVCELMPSAWKDSFEKYPDPAEEWPLGRNDPRCQAIAETARQRD